MVDCKDAGKGALRVFALIFAVLASMQVASALEGWNFSRDITITNNLNQDLSDYQIKITLNTAELISNGKMRSDCGDIRFTDSNGNLLNYWVRPDTCNTSNTEIWVKVPSIPANGQTVVWLWYGNPSAESLSDASSVFIRVIDGVVASWLMDEGSGNKVYDTSGNNNHGTIYGATWVDSPYGKALSFDGVNDYVETDNPLELSTPLTLIVWFNYEVRSDINMLLSNSLGGYGSAGFRFYVNNYQTENRVLSIESGTGTAGSNIGTPAGAVEPYIWHFGAVVINGSNSRLFLNDKKYTGNLKDFTTTEKIRVGRHLTGSFPFKGKVELVAVFNRALTDEEISIIYNNRIYTTPSYSGKALICAHASQEPRISIGEEKRPYLYVFIKNEKTGETLNNFTVSYYEIGESGEFLNQSTLENPEYVPLLRNKKYFVCAQNDTFFERCKVIFRTFYPAEETFYLPPQADTIYTTVTVFDPTGFFYSIGSTVALYVKEGEIMDERFIDASHKASLPLIIGKTYLVGVRNPQDSRIVGYISSAQYSITLYVNQLEFPQQHYTAVLFNCTQTDSYIKCNWSTQAGNTSYATMEIYDVNGNLAAKYEAETPSGSFTFLQTGEIYRVVFKVINDIQNVEYSFTSLNLTAIPTPTPVTPAYITPGVSIPSFDVKSVPAEYRMLFIGGLALVASMFFRRTHAPIGMAVSLAIIVASVVSGLLEINHNLIILLILILAISFFEIERTRGTVR